MTIQLTQTGSVNFIQSGNTTLGNSVADLKISNIGNSSTYMTIATSGNVGVGTTSPTYTLDINGTLDISNSNGLFIFNSAGNIGIGTTAPDNILTFGRSDVISPYSFSVRNTSGRGELAIAGGTGQFSNFAVAGDMVLRSNNNKLFLTSNAANVGICVATTGNVGFGTITPGQKLQVDGGIRVVANDPITTEGAHLQWNRTLEGETWLINQRGGGNANAGIRFGNINTSNVVTAEWMRILHNGNVGIGTTNPTATLDVVGTMTVPGGTFNAGWSAPSGGFDFLNVSSSYYIISGVFYGVWQGTFTTVSGSGTIYQNLPVNPKDNSSFLGYWTTSRYNDVYWVRDNGTSQAFFARPGSTNALYQINGDIQNGDVLTIMYRYIVA